MLTTESYQRILFIFFCCVLLPKAGLLLEIQPLDIYLPTLFKLDMSEKDEVTMNTK